MPLIKATSGTVTMHATSKLERALLEKVTEHPVTMIELVDHCRMARQTHFPPRRIAELVTKMEAHGYVTITE